MQPMVVISIKSCKVQMLVLTVACSWASLLKQYIQQAILSFYQTKITWIPALILHLKHVKMLIRVTALAFDPCVLCYRSPYTLYSSLCSKKSEKRVAARLRIRSEWACLSEDSCLGVSWQRRASLAFLTLFLIRDQQGRTLVILLTISKYLFQLKDQF